MEGLYKNKYKIDSTRLPNYNYSQSGYYFVTICTANRFCYFGNIKNSEMILNENGKIIYQELLKTPQIRKNVILDEFIIMPNHVHTVIIIGEQTPCRDAFNASPVRDNTPVKTHSMRLRITTKPTLSHILYITLLICMVFTECMVILRRRIQCVSTDRQTIKQGFNLVLFIKKRPYLGGNLLLPCDYHRR